MKIETVVADASTLIGLSRIEQLNLLRELYGEVVIPQSVYDEVVIESKDGSEKITYHAHRTWFDEDPSKGSKSIAIPADYNPIFRTQPSS